MSDDLIIVPDGEPEFSFVECKFTVEGESAMGGDWERNTGGARTRLRVTFEGFMTSDIQDALVETIGRCGHD